MPSQPLVHLISLTRRPCPATPRGPPIAKDSLETNLNRAIADNNRRNGPAKSFVVPGVWRVQYQLKEVVMSAIARPRACDRSRLPVLVSPHRRPERPSATTSPFGIAQGPMLGRDFERRQNEFRSWKLQERRRVPTYNALLNDAVIDFHKHI